MTELDKVKLQNFQAIWSIINKRCGKPADLSQGVKWFKATRQYDSVSVYRGMVNLLNERKVLNLSDLVNRLEQERLIKIYRPIKSDSNFI